MLDTSNWHYETIADAHYYDTSASVAQGTPGLPTDDGNVLVVHTESGCPNPSHEPPCGCVVAHDGSTFSIMNGPWTKNNFVLQFFAYMGVRPSTFEDELVGATVPLERRQNGMYFPPDDMFDMGKQRLVSDECDWFVVSQ